MKVSTAQIFKHLFARFANTRLCRFLSIKDENIKTLVYSSAAVFFVVVTAGHLMEEHFFTGHDTDYHMALYANIVELYLGDGNYFSKILPSAAGEIGLGNPIFYGTLPHHIAAWLTVGLELPHMDFGFRAMIGLVTLFTGIFTFCFIRRVSGDNIIAFTGTVIYGYWPYRLSCLYIRGAFSEYAAFMFLPLTLWGVYELVKGKYRRFLVLFASGWAGILLTHMISGIYLAIAVIVYLVINFRVFYDNKKIKKKAVVYFIGACVFALALSGCFLLPLFEHYVFGDYAISHPEIIRANAETMNDNRLIFFEFFLLSRSEGITLFYIPLWVTLMVYCAIKYWKRLEKINTDADYKQLAGFSLITGCVFLLMTSHLMWWNFVPSFLLMLQFPWRLMSLIGLFFAVGATFVLVVLSRQYRIIIAAAIIILSIPIIAGVYSGTTFNKKFGSESYYNEAKNSFSALGHECEYLPYNTSKAVMPDGHPRGGNRVDTSHALLGEYFKNRRVREIGGAAPTVMVVNDNGKGGEYNFEIIGNYGEETIFEIPLLFYFGYEAELIGKDGITTRLKVTESENGLLCVKTSLNGIVSIRYRGTVFNAVGNILTVVSFSGLGFLIAFFVIIAAIRKSKNLPPPGKDCVCLGERA